MRVDANVSVNRAGEPWGTRCEIKNLNSLRSLGRAIDHEALRQIDLLECGERVRQETRHWDEASGPHRHPPREGGRRRLPVLPRARPRAARSDAPTTSRASTRRSRRCPPIAARTLAAAAGRETDRRRRRARGAARPRRPGRRRHRGRRRRRPGAHPHRAQPRRRRRRVAVGRAPRRARPDGDRRRAHRHPGQDGARRGRRHRRRTRPTIAKEKGFEALDTGALEGIVDEVIAAHPEEWEDFRTGDDKARGKLTGFFMGKVMQASKGQADGKAATALLRSRPAWPLRLPQPTQGPGVRDPPGLGRANVLGAGLSGTGSLPAMADERRDARRHQAAEPGRHRRPEPGAGARAMLRAVGMTDDDWDKPQVAVASSWNEVTPCNMPLDRLAKRSKVGVRDAGGFPLEFTTIAVSDGISMGHEGMRASLVSREIIADSVEAMMHAERFDGLVTFAGCDKSLPGMLMAAARVNLPSVFLYGGSILPGTPQGPGHRHRVGVRGGRRPRRRHHRRRRARRHRARRLPERGQLRRHVHRQHDGVGGRGHRHVAARLVVAARARQPPRRLRLRLRPGGRAPARAGHPAAADHDQGSVRERHRRRDGARRFHQRGAPPPRHRHRGAGRARPRGLQQGRRPRAAHRRHQAARQVPHGRHRPDRRGADGDAAPARRRAAPRRLPHRHRQDDRREPRRPRPAGARRRRSSTRCPTRCTPSAASPCSRARWPPRARW